MTRHGVAVALGVVLFYGVCAVVAQIDLALHAGTDVYAQAMLGNDCLLHAWTIAWGQHALATDPRGAFDANIFFPYPRTLLYSDHLLGVAVAAAPLRLVTDDPLLVHNLVTIAAPALNALAMHALVLELTGSHAAALVGGVLYGFPPLRFTVDRCQVQMLVAWWLPLIVLWGRRAVTGRGWGWGCLAGGALAFQLASGVYLTAYAIPFIVLAHLAWLRRHPPRRHPAGWAALVAADALAVAANLPVARAYREVQDALGIVRSPFLNTLLSLQPDTLPGLVPAITLGLLLAAAVLAGRALPDALRAERGVLLATTVGGLVLALGPVVPVSAEHGWVWGPYQLLVSLPGYSALRVPARYLHVALLGAAPLAAGGFAALRPPGRRATRVACAAVLAAIAVESWPGRPPTDPLAAPASEPVYRWLAAQGEAVRILELPLDAYALNAARYEYASTAHWKRMLAGTSGLTPPLYPYMVRELARFPAPDVTAQLVALGVTDVVVHESRMAAGAVAAIAASRDLKVRYRAGTTVVYRLRPGLRPLPWTPPGRPLPRTAWHASATQDAAAAGRAIDGDPASAWSSWGALEQAVDAWADPVPLLVRFQRFLDARPVRFELDLGTPAEVAGLELRLGGSEALGPPTLLIEGSLDGASWARLGRGLVAVPDVRVLVTHPADGRFGLRLARPRRLRYLRFSAAGYEWRLGDLQVYAP